MSDEPFRRPGSDPGPHRASPRTESAVWQPDTGVALRNQRVSPSQVRTEIPAHRGARLRTVVTVGSAGLLVGVVVGLAVSAAVIEQPQLPPVDITLDAFPREVLGEERDDLQWRDAWSKPIMEKLDAEFRDQVEGYRFAYGGEGATLTYGSEEFVLTVVNGQIATAVPNAGSDQSDSTPTVVSLDSEQTSCVSEDPPRDQTSALDLAQILEDDSKDVFFWLDEGQVRARTECVLFDTTRNLSLHLTGSGRVERKLQTASILRDELVAIHANLID